MKYYKLSEDVATPSYGTEKSAGFDIAPYLTSETKIRCYNPHNREMYLPVKVDGSGKVYASILPNFRALLPTGLVFDIPEDKYIQINIRSSAALKSGVVLANQTAIIDEDYTDETFIMVTNIADTPMQIFNGQRIAQCTIHNRNAEVLEQMEAPVDQKTDRVGGLGSTGEFVAEEPAKRKAGRPKKEV
jgi:dUTP pyrophosphatase